MELDEEQLQTLYTWVDDIPLSRPKRNIGRDFSDGVLMAEVIHHHHPRLVELHNYSSANALQQKLYNWNTLNQKVFKRMGFALSRHECEAVANGVQGAVERVLLLVRSKLDSMTKADGQSNGEQVSGYEAQQTQPSHSRTSQGGLRPMVPTSTSGQEDLPEILNYGRAKDERDLIIQELRETNKILETKVVKLEQLVKLKDAKVQALMSKLQASGLP